jgi:hypothetical protein
MNLVKLGKLEAGITVATDKHGREHVLVVAKQTFTIGPHGSCELAGEQQPLVYADEFHGEPGMSATLYESDFALFTPRCDVLLNGSAYAPDDVPVESIEVSLRVGSMRKSFRVVGDRVWRKRFLSMRTSRPKPFTRLAIHYGRAYGGTDEHEKKPAKRQTYIENPVGLGFYPLTKRKALRGKRLPTTEELDRPVRKAQGKYRPMSFGPVGRNVPERVRWAGTYDEDWLENVFPFLPADFDLRYHQVAPTDQQIPWLAGGEAVELRNLTPECRTVFTLPDGKLPVKVLYRSHHEDLAPVVDTLVLEPDDRRFTLVSRASTPLKGKLHTVQEVWVGTPSPARLRALATGKQFIDKEVP